MKRRTAGHRYPRVLGVAAFFLVACICIPWNTSEAAAPLDFARDVYPLLRRSCFECHGAEKQEAGLRLDTKQDALDSGVIEIGDPDTSELVRRIELPRGHDEVMPVIGDPMNKREVALIRRWIAAGAVWPDQFEPPLHWAYLAPERPPIPRVSNPNWPQNPIDHFVLANLDEYSLKPSPRAEPATLLRRVHLDLIGLPPMPGEVAAFEVDSSPAALAGVVDDLLSRPQFGERWARPWLDLARYADSHGFQRDDFRDLWAYRDWVIESLNDDMPYDQFTIEQLAGDLLPNATESQKIATGFHRCAPTNVEAGSLPEETRIEQVIDRVNTTGAVWLGSTLECAQCHDHKFDPFTARDYYRFLAFFNSTALEADRNNPNQPSSIAFRGPALSLSDPAIDAERERLQAERAAFSRQDKTRQALLSEDLEAWSADVAKSARTQPQQHTLEIQEFQSTGNTDTHTIRDDGAVLLVGDDAPDTDTYVITTELSAADVRAIRLDVLTDESLPGGGPGRGDAKRTNFVLNEFTAVRVDDSGSHQPLEFVAAQADFSQANWDVRGAIDGIAKTGWAIAPQFGKAHWATFVLQQPIDASGGVRLQISMKQQFGSARTIGCFKLSAVSGDLDSQSIPADIVKLATAPAAKWTQKQRQRLIEYRQSSDPPSLALQRQLSENQRALDKLKPVTTQIMVELDSPRDSHLFIRGDYRKPGDPVTPGTPSWLHRLSVESENDSRLDRLTLARWLVDPANPLVARVTVNRWWAELFGAGIVRTAEDFGIKGDFPTHPGLLDWLALEFVQHDWSIKHVLRTIVLSSTYQQSSAITPQLAEIDDQNRWLARGPRVRMDAEMIRDNALAISDLISLKLFGPPIHPYQPDGIWTKVGGQNYEYVVSPGDEKYRRGVYVVIKRGAPYPSFVNFDADNRFTCTVQRSRSNTPLQALTLLNDPVYVEATKAIAIRAASAARNQSIDSTLIDEVRRCTARTPDERELSVLRELYESQLAEAQQRSARGDKLFAGADVPSNVTMAELSAWYSVATVLMNLHETITKE